jgi:hypothetical protein
MDPEGRAMSSWIGLKEGLKKIKAEEPGLVWQLGVPELQTRTKLITALEHDEGLRKGFFKKVDALMSIVERLIGHPRASWVITLIYRESRRDLVILEQRIKERAVRAEMMGCFRNVYKNALAKVTGHAWKRFSPSPHDVERS